MHSVYATRNLCQLLRPSPRANGVPASREGTYAGASNRNDLCVRVLLTLLVLSSLPAISGCYVPLRSPGILASHLPCEYRTPMRSTASTLNWASLSLEAPDDYILGPHDTLQVAVPGLSDPGQPNLRTIDVQIMADGTIQLPLAGTVRVGGLNLAEAQNKIDEVYANGIMVSPRTSVSLLQKATLDVTVVGEVKNPGVYPLPKFQNDVPHALALAGGITPLGAEVIEIHRSVTPEEFADRLPLTVPAQLDVMLMLDHHPEELATVGPSIQVVIQIPLRGGMPSIAVGDQVFTQVQLTADDITLRPADVVRVPPQPDEVFFVVGPLSTVRAVNFTVSDRDRRLGNAFILPRDRDIDVVTAVTMAGYIDPIESPKTVTLHRSLPGAPPLLVHVDLIRARYDWNENLYVEPGDIIYLNPDPAWWSRRMFDRIAPELFLTPYREAMQLWINPLAARR